MYILHIVDVWFKQNYTIVIGQHWTNGLTLQVRYFWITIRFPNEKIYRWKLMWADFDIELPWLYSNYFDNLNDKLKHLVFFYLVTFCSCLLTSWEFLLWKKNFWHGPSISPRPTTKNALWNSLQIILASRWNPWTMSDRVEFTIFFHEPF